MKSLTSLLAALSVYLLVLGAVLYSYRSQPSYAAAENPHRTEIITLGIVGESGTQKVSTQEVQKPTVPTQTAPKQRTSSKEGEIVNSAQRKTNRVSPPKPKETKKSEKTILSAPRNSPTTKPKETPVQAPAPPPRKKYIVNKVAPEDPVRYIALKKVSKATPEFHRRHKKHRVKHATRSKNSRRRGTGTSHRNIHTAKNTNRFLYRLKKRINHNKNYPRLARRRGITGSVHVSFSILRNGNVGAISARGSHIFYSSAKNAVRRAFPVNPAKTSHALPWRISVVLRYRLH